MTALLALLLLAPPAAGPRKPAAAARPDVLLQAMSAELQRCEGLKSAGATPPYFGSLLVEDNGEAWIAAAGGALLYTRADRGRPVQARIRLGGPSGDESNSTLFPPSAVLSFGLDRAPLDSQPLALRTAFWLAFDAAYKTSARAAAAKSMLLGPGGGQALPNYTAGARTQLLLDARPAPFDEAAWTARLRALSRLTGPLGRVELLNAASTLYFLDTEGVVVRAPDPVCLLRAHVVREAAGGELAASFEHVSRDLAASFVEADFRRDLEQFVRDCDAAAQAPAGAAGAGPVLFEPLAAAQLIAEVLAPALAPQPLPLVEPGRPVPDPTRLFAQSLDRPVLPAFLSVRDDATLCAWRGRPLAGCYAADREGQRPQPVTLVAGGVLKAFLSTRAPAIPGQLTNGHARLPSPLGIALARPGNLIVEAASPLPPAALRDRFLETIRAQGAPYGILVRRLQFASSPAPAGAAPAGPAELLFAFRVYPDGRQEPVRGLRLRQPDPRDFQRAAAASSETAVFEYLLSAPLPDFREGAATIAPASVVAPGLLFPTLEVEAVPAPPAVP